MPTDGVEPEGLWDEQKAGEYLGVSHLTVRDWRRDGRGPRYIKLGKGKKTPVRYRPEDVRAFVDAGLQEPTTKPKTAKSS